MSAIIRIKELNKRRQRKSKLRELRSRYAKARSEGEKEAILVKAKKIALWLSEEEFLAPLAAK